MKIGKNIKLGEYENIKLSYGTVDCKNLKSIYIELNSWLEPKNNVDYENLIYYAKRNIKQRIRNEQTTLFKKESIVDFDIKTNSVREGKRSFMDLQITLFTDKFFDIKNKETKVYIYDLLKKIINNDLIDKNLFIFHKTKV